MKKLARKPVNARIILRTTGRLFRHYGYRKTGMVDVAKRLDMSPTNIYRFFQSKDDLRRGFLRRLLDINYRLASLKCRRVGTASSRISRLLIAQLLMTCDIIDSHRSIHDLIMFGLERDDDLFVMQIDRMASLLETLISDGIRELEFADQNAYEAARLVVVTTAAMWHQVLLSNRRANDGLSPDDLVDFVLDALRYGRPAQEQKAI